MRSFLGSAGDDLLKKVLVVCGGLSTEREVSIRSGSAVYKALKEAGFDAELLDINYSNIDEIADRKPDVVYIALHGKGGEDGKIQGLLEWHGIAYTGPGVTASAVCMDKVLTKDILKSHGINTPDYSVYDQWDIEACNGEEIAERFGMPLVVKASCQGSSIGVEIVNDAKRIKEAACNALKFGDHVLIERFVEGVEVTVPIIGNDEARILPIIEITAENEFYDYQSKYTPGMSHHIIPARVSDKTEEKIKSEALKAYRAVGCRGISRVDLIVDKSGTPYVIEINTVPGMTETSLVPDSASYAGISFPELVTEIVEFATER